MKDTVERLLATEARAEQLVAEAREAGDRLLADARVQARRERQRFEERLPALRETYLEQAREQADAACREASRRHEERARALRGTAARHREAAVDAALALMLDAEAGDGA